MINTLALISQKGRSGKTTLALALAAAHERAGGQAAVLNACPPRGSWTAEAVRGFGLALCPVTLGGASGTREGVHPRAHGPGSGAGFPGGP